MPPVTSSTGLAITNPLILYRSLVATKAIEPSPAQHRLAIHLQILYDRLKDYEPIVQYGHRLQQIGRALGSTPGQPGGDFNAPAARRSGVLSSLFEQKNARDKLALTKVLTSHEAALQLESPRGLMLHGEVGTGKSMLIDLFADCLPNSKKKRWHFTTFMLETFAKLEHLRRSRHIIIPASLGREDDYSLLWLAREMISTSPILFLDEFQLPDRASSKIMSNLMTSFFHLGGVLIATSNRMPEELAKAAGMEFTPPPTRLESLGWKFGLTRGSARSKSENMFSGQGELAGFLEVLKARCEVWEMEGGKDYRRRESEVEAALTDGPETESKDHTVGFGGPEQMAPGNIGLGYEQSIHTEKEKEPVKYTIPKNYFLKPASSTSPSEIEAWLNSYNTAQSLAAGGDTSTSGLPWEASTMRVYGRTVIIPRAHDGVTSWTFAELCASNLGPADYVSLASTFHTLILTEVPVLTWLLKNEARRFITLLDALYEARCKLLISADAGPDDLFFPERKASSNTSAGVDGRNADDAVYAETFSEVYQDATAPFRPNISLYAESEPDRTHSRLQGILNGSGRAADQLEDDPPNIPSSHRAGAVDTGDATMLSGKRGHGVLGPDFAQAGMFTGEDEKFAYKRARSRLWEMCGARWWAREGEGWWRPVDAAVRRWERAVGDDGSGLAPRYAEGVAREGEGMGISRALGEDEPQPPLPPQGNEGMYRHGASPFRVSQEPPPKFQWTHIWGMMTWGKKAGAWGQGVEGLKERKKSGDGGDKDKR